MKARIQKLIEDAKSIRNDMVTNSDPYFHMDAIIDDLTLLLEGVEEDGTEKN